MRGGIVQRPLTQTEQTQGEQELHREGISGWDLLTRGLIFVFQTQIQESLPDLDSILCFNRNALHSRISRFSPSLDERYRFYTEGKKGTEDLGDLLNTPPLHKPRLNPTNASSKSPALPLTKTLSRNLAINCFTFRSFWCYFHFQNSLF